MKGLLIKDLKMILKNKIMLVCVIGVVLILLLMTDNVSYSFMIGYVVMLCTMFVISTISQDDYNNTISYLMTLPVTRKTYVAEKYLLMILSALTGLILGGAGCALWSHRLDEQFLEEAAAVFVVLVIFQLIMLPLQLKFGGEKSRIILALMFAAFSGVIIAIQKLSEGASFTGSGAGQLLNRALMWVTVQSMGTLAALVAVFMLLCAVVSISVSTRIMSRKEF